MRGLNKVSRLSQLLVNHSDVEFEEAKNKLLTELEIKEADTNLISPEKDLTIGIDKIRQVIKQSKLSNNSTKQVVLIEQADKLTVQAQNALLKVLEESHENMRLILFTKLPSKLLDTVVSRLETVKMKSEQTEPVNSQEEAILRASGFSGEMLDKYRSNSVPMLTEARQWLSGDLLARLKIVKSLKERPIALEFVDALIFLNYGLLTKQANNSNKVGSNSTIIQLEAILIVKKRIEANGNIKLNLLQL